MTRTIRSQAATAIVATLVLALAACTWSVRSRYRPYYYDTSQCYWNWVADAYGGHEQLFCYSPDYATYRPYVYEGVYVRRYPEWYTGPRTAVVSPPDVTYVQPRGVVVVPRPLAPPAYAVPPQAGGGPYVAPAQPAQPPPYIAPAR